MIRNILWIVALGLVPYLSASASSAFLDVATAKRLAELAYENCQAEEFAVSVSVVDSQGTLLVFLRGEKSGPHTVETSFKKAYTAASLKAPTGVLSLLVNQPGLSQLGDMANDILLLRGGLPIFSGASLIGGIGLSGAPSPKAEETCGVDALKEVFKD